MSAYQNDKNPEKRNNRTVWLIGCGVGAVILLCVGLLIIIGGFAGLKALMADEAQALSVDIDSPSSAINEGDPFTITVALANEGSKNITFDRILLPNELFTIATLTATVPPDLSSMAVGDQSQYTLDWVIAPNGRQTLAFTFEALQAGEIRGDITVYAGDTTTTSALEIDISPKLSSTDNAEGQLPISPLAEDIPEDKIILFDEFNDNTNNWEVGDFGDAYIDIANGQMVIDVFTDNLWGYSILLDDIYESVNLVVDGRVINPAKDGNLGIICGFQDEGNFSALEIKPDGYYSIWVFNKNRYIVLVNWTYSEMIKSSGVYSIGAHCSPNRLVLFLDDVTLADAVPPNYKAGKVGVIAGTYFYHPLTVEFDNFAVLRP